MYKKLWICLILIIILTSVYAKEKPRVAVMPFKPGMGVSIPEASYLADRVRTGLIATEVFDVISNDQIQEMIKLKQTKQELGSGSCTTEKCIIDLGNSLECEKMIVGTAAGAFGEFTINIKLLDVVKQKYEFAREITVKSKNEFPDAARQIVKLIADKHKGTPKVAQKDKEATKVAMTPGKVNYSGMLWRSVVLPGWGHLYANQKRGYIYGGLWSGIGEAFIWSHFNYTSKNDDYLRATSDFDSKYDASTSAYDLRSYISFAFVGVYLLAITDMLFTGNGYMLSEKSDTTSNLDFNIYYGSSMNSPVTGYRSDERMDFVINWRF